MGDRIGGRLVVEAIDERGVVVRDGDAVKHLPLHAGIVPRPSPAAAADPEPAAGLPPAPAPTAAAMVPPTNATPR